MDTISIVSSYLFQILYLGVASHSVWTMLSAVLRKHSSRSLNILRSTGNGMVSTASVSSKAMTPLVCISKRIPYHKLPPNNQF